MEIQCTDNKTFELIDGTKKLGQISYKSLFTHKAVLIVESEEYEINTSGIFSAAMSVIKQRQEVANMKMSWKGDVMIVLSGVGEFRLKAKSLFNSTYVLEDRNQLALLFLTPNFNWKKFNYNYIIATQGKEVDVLLVLLAVYAANYCMAALSGVY